jgi:hypothetical protein
MQPYAEWLPGADRYFEIEALAPRPRGFTVGEAAWEPSRESGRTPLLRRSGRMPTSTEAQKRPSGKISLEGSDFYLAGNETAVWVELQLGHPHDPNNPAKNFSLRARLGNLWAGKHLPA